MKQAPAQTKRIESHELFKFLVDPKNLKSELEKLTKQNWIIEDILPADGDFVIIFGQQKSYKSFIALDWALSIANGVDYHGKEVEQGSVIYIAAEGRSGLLKRVEAWRQQRELKAIKNFYPLMKAITINDSQARQQLNEFINLFPVKPALVFIDTLAQSMVGDENGQGMNDFVKGVTDIIEKTGSKVVVIHHTPKGGDTMRGHSSLPGALNYSYLVKKYKPISGVAVMSCTDAKDQDDKAEYFFNMNLKDIGITDAKGKAITSLVPELNTKIVPDAAIPESKKLKGKRALVYKALEKAISESGEGGATLEQWKAEYYSGVKGILTDSNRKTTFSRETENLLAEGLVVAYNGICFINEPNGIPLQTLQNVTCNEL